MEEDGIMLNIATGGGSSGARIETKKGGRWTDRLKAKRVAKRKLSSISRPVPGDRNPFNAENGDSSRPVKRPRKDAPPTTPRATSTTTPKTSGQFISSLFSSNPAIPKPEGVPAARRPTAKPSNAPLTDASTFEGLGLDPLLVNHLSSKMGILKPTSIQRAALPSLLSSPTSCPRDVFIQSQTGSGKTLSFLLPIIQDLLPLSSLSYIDRSIGTLAIIIAPTRELAKQISDVLENLLKLRLRTTVEVPEEDDGQNNPRLTRWLVSGLLTGGSTRTHEKARLRKGIPILVSTPGRLLDHLQNTESFSVGKCRWLILDEADRLMELGFEETIQGILKGLEGRRNLAFKAAKEGKGTDVGGWDWRERRTVLCSATIREDVQKLAGTTLKNPIVIKGGSDALDEELKLNTSSTSPSKTAPSASEKFTPPSQLSQKYVVVPLKLRLVTLISLLRSLLSQSSGRMKDPSASRGTKIIVFLSCTDSVDFHWSLLGGASMGAESENKPASEDGSISDDSDDEKPEPIEAHSSLLPSTSIYRLHGSLPLQTRLASLKGFSSTSNGNSSILLCTSVASRGLDLPLVRAVVQYDLPTEGGATEYVHRVGRTARAGKGGEAWAFVGPSEEQWVGWVEGKMNNDEDGKKVKLDSVGVETVLKNGFGGKGTEYEDRATDVQLSFERWVLKPENTDLARKAFTSHMRAYATHPSDEKHIFHVRNLHIGHLAKAFALREAPTMLGNAKKKKQGKDKAKAGAVKNMKRPKGAAEEVSDPQRTEERMKAVVRSQGRLTKKGGLMMNTGLAEFQVGTGGYQL